MKINFKNKKTILLFVIILIVLAAGIIYFCINNNNENSDTYYIDIWIDNSMDSDIDMYSMGTGENEKIYLGRQPMHYHIHKTGEVYTYLESSFENKMTGERDPATINYITKLSEEDMEKLVVELKEVVDSNETKEAYPTMSYWFVKIGNKTTRVDVNVKKVILEKYIEE